MNRTLAKQATMCDMMPAADGSSGTNVVDDGAPQSCLMRDVGRDPVKQANDLYSFVQWQEHNEDMLIRSVQGHHQSNV